MILRSSRICFFFLGFMAHYLINLFLDSLQPNTPIILDQPHHTSTSATLHSKPTLTLLDEQQQQQQHYNHQKQQPYILSLPNENNNNSNNNNSNNNKSNVERVNAAFVILLRNKDLHPMRKTMRMLESTFNQHYNYPYIFLNDEPFTDHFKTHISAMTKSIVKFGVVPREHWSYPAHINQTQAALNRKDMEARNVAYADSESYRHMCRYESGFIFHHELVQEYDYYWRVEPGVSFSCDLDFDPFMVMKTKKIKYGFTIALPEFVNTIPTLWENVRQFMRLHPEHISKRNSLEWISYDKGETYNNCHFWSNFEIVDLSFFRSKAYTDFFNLLDQAGGFFYERWGDAPVHSIAAALMLERREIRFFNEIGYRHEMYEHCPESPSLQLKCACDPKDNVDWAQFSCLKRFLET